VRLSEGKLSGLANMARWGDATLETKPDRVVLSFTLAVKDLHASYIWRRRSIRGEVSASVGRAFLSVKLRQKVKAGGTRPEVLDFSLGNITKPKVGLHGLGPLNWAGKKIVLSLVTHIIRHLLEQRARETLKQQLDQVNMLDQIAGSFLPHGVHL